MAATITAVDRSDFVYAAADRRDRFLRAVDDLGLSRRSLVPAYWQAVQDSTILRRVLSREEAETLRREHHGIALREFEGVGLDRSGLIERLRDLLGGIERTVESEEVREVRVPLLRVDAPGVRRSRSVCRLELEDETASSWTVEILGSGMGADQSVKLRYTREIAVSSRGAKELSTRVPVILRQLRLRHRRRHYSPVVEHEMAPLPVGRTLPTEIRSIDPTSPACVGSSGGPIDLRRDRSADATKVELEMEAQRKHRVPFGLELNGIATGGEASVTHLVRIITEHVLPPGRMYTPVFLASPLGVRWRVVPPVRGQPAPATDDISG